jgi:hypothetical protein
MLMTGAIGPIGFQPVFKVAEEDRSCQLRSNDYLRLSCVMSKLALRQCEALRHRATLRADNRAELSRESRASFAFLKSLSALLMYDLSFFIFICSLFEIFTNSLVGEFSLMEFSLMLDLMLDWDTRDFGREATTCSCFMDFLSLFSSVGIEYFYLSWLYTCNV